MAATSPALGAPLPALHAAIWAGDVDRVRALLAACSSASSGVSRSSSSDRNSSDDDGDSAVHELMEARDAHGNSALHLAVRVIQPSQRAIVQLLLVRSLYAHSIVRSGQQQ